MPIEKFHSYSDSMRNKFIDEISVINMLGDKINELIDFINAHELDRSEHMDRMIERLDEYGISLRYLQSRVYKLENATQPKEELKVCPWCNTKPTIIMRHNNAVVFGCANSSCRVSPRICSLKSKQEAVAAWNHRA